MKLINWLITIPGLYLVLILFSCSQENEDDIKENVGKHAVTLVDQDGNPMPVTKGTSTLPSGSRVSGTGYYANGDNCTLSYSPASGYNSTCSWDWHDGTSIQAASSSSATIRRDYKVTVSETQTPKSYLLTLVASPTSGGSVSGGGTYNAGTSVNISAKTNSGFSFDGWYNGASKLSSSSSYSYSMTSTNSTLTAKFKEDEVEKGYYYISAYVTNTWTSGGVKYEITATRSNTSMPQNLTSTLYLTYRITVEYENERGELREELYDSGNAQINAGSYYCDITQDKDIPGAQGGISYFIVLNGPSTLGGYRVEY